VKEDQRILIANLQSIIFGMLHRIPTFISPFIFIISANAQANKKNIHICIIKGGVSFD
jgi:hypothetical protein